MSKRADLTPPLGYPGGPCHLVQRIHDEVRNPRMRDYLTDRVEEGKPLDKSDERMLYDIEDERGPGGPISKILITPHAQHRMDLRGVTVPEVRLGFRSFLKQLNDWKSRGAWEYEAITKDLLHGRSIEWTDPKTRLFLVFKMEGRGQAVLITTYWKGVPDPRPPGSCAVKASSVVPGVKTFVSPQMEQGLPGRENKSPQVLPLPEQRREVHLPGARYNTPPASNPSGGDRSLSKDRVRTLAVPGEQYGHPVVDSTVIPKRRAAINPGFPSPRQREQGGGAKSYHQKYYQNNRGEILTRSKQRYRSVKNDSNYQLSQERRRKWPERFERRPGGYSSNAERSKDYRDKHRDAATEPDERGAAAVRQSPVKRQRRQRGMDRVKSKLYYRRNRNKSKHKSRQRYRRLKNNPSFKRQQQIRRKNPQRFKRRLSLVEDMMAIMFVIGSDMHLGQVEALSPVDGIVSFSVITPEASFTRAMALADFLDSVVFLTYDDIDNMYRLIDTILGEEAYDESFEDTGEEQEREATFYMKVDEPDVNLEPMENRELPPANQIVRREPHNPHGFSSRVIPQSHPDFVNKKANFWAKLDRNLRSLLVTLVQSPLWRQYAAGTRSDRDILEWFKSQGVPMTVREWDHLMTTVVEGGRYPGLKVAVRIADLESGVDPKIRAKARSVKSKLRRVDQKNGVWLYDVQGSEGTYRVRVKAQARKGNLSGSDIQVSCSCPFWQWQGPEYHAKRGGYLYGRPVGTATKPDERDPQNKHLVCKHALAVLDRMRDIAIRRGKQASAHWDLARRVATRHLSRFGFEAGYSLDVDTSSDHPF